MEDVDVTPTVHSALRAASTVASAASRGASAAAHGAKVAAEIFAPPATAAPRSPMLSFVLALLAAEIAVLVVLAVPFAVPGRARAVAMLSLSPGAERVRWVLYTTLAGLGGLLWDAGRRWNGAEKEVKNLLEDQSNLRVFYDTFTRASRLQTDFILVAAALFASFLIYVLHFRTLREEPGIARRYEAQADSAAQRQAKVVEVRDEDADADAGLRQRAMARGA
ncbi:hypothetical protein DFJ74DRAFT_692961 [Hyaloraphidium curvatum]|nr:hypothetical protein DFJ74DRAFT_692961 [Hyaloraphidium curvatum]